MPHTFSTGASWATWVGVAFHLLVLAVSGWIIIRKLEPSPNTEASRLGAVFAALPVGVVAFTLFLFVVRRFVSAPAANIGYWTLVTAGTIILAAHWFSGRKRGPAGRHAPREIVRIRISRSVALVAVSATAAALLATIGWSETQHSFTQGGTELMWHAGQVASAARFGVPARDPSEPDHATTYRYAFELFASSFYGLGLTGTGALSAATGVTIAAHFLALVAALCAFLRWRWLSLASGLVGIFYAPTGWLVYSVDALWSGKAADLNTLVTALQQRYLLSPRAGFSLMASLHQRPSFSFSVVAWCVGVILSGLVVTHLRLKANKKPNTGQHISFIALLTACGLCWALVIGAGEYLLPSAGFALAAMVITIGRPEQYARRHLVGATCGVLVALALGLAIVPSPLLSLSVEAERPVRASLASRPGYVYVYGEEWLLVGRRFATDVGPLLIPALGIIAAIALRRANTVVVWFWGGAVGALLAASTIRLRPDYMAADVYKFVSTAQVMAAPLLLYAATELAAVVRKWFANRQFWDLGHLIKPVLTSTIAIASLGGILWGLQGLVRATAQSEVPPIYYGDVEIGRTLQRSVVWPRVVIVGGPLTHQDYKRSVQGATMAYLWAGAEVATPIGSFVGHPSYYEAAWRRASQELDVDAMTRLQATHVYVLPAYISSEQQRRLSNLVMHEVLFLRARFDGTTPEQRRLLYGISYRP